MARRASVADVKARFAEYVRRAETGEVVVLVRHGRPVAALVTVDDLPQLERLRAAGASKGLVSVAGGWAGSEELVRNVVQKKRSRSRRVRSL